MTIKNEKIENQNNKEKIKKQKAPVKPDLPKCVLIKESIKIGDIIKELKEKKKST